MSLEKHDRRIPPVRGLVLTRNARGRAYAALDIRRWMRLNRTVHKTEKVDLLVRGNLTTPISTFLQCANELHMKLSLRVDCDDPPYNLASLKQDGLFDIFLTPRRPGTNLDAWLDAARAAALPVRVQLHPPLDGDLEPERLVTLFAAAHVTSVNMAVSDPFLETGGCRGKKESKAHVKAMLSFADALEAYDIESNLVGLPFCLARADHRARVVNRPQFFLDHQQYTKDAYTLALTLFERPPVIASKVILMLLARRTLFNDPIDAKLLPWLLEKPWLRARAVAAHRLTRHLRLARSVPKPIEETAPAHEHALDGIKAVSRRAAGPICSDCSLQDICDRETSDLRRVLPGLKIEAIEGERFLYPMYFARRQQKHYDAVDSDRIHSDTLDEELAVKARAVIEENPPDRAINAQDYSVEGHWSHSLPGGVVRWFGLTNSEKVSTPLATLDPPFAVSVVFGGGIAEYIGFRFGRDCRIVCPMEAYRHQLDLFVDVDGRYVLLRDGIPIHPQTFDGNFYVPGRLGDGLQPRISIWNIDYSIVTQNVSLWTDSVERRDELAPAKYSVVVVCVRYARRLAIVLQSLAHQTGIDPGAIEVIVAYVPGLDSTEDVIDTVRLLCPDLRIRRSPFQEDRAREKGFMINESARKATGEWVVLLDADTLLPPDFFARMEGMTDSEEFLVPDGRKMLTRETTAKILLGEIHPWEHWDELFEDAGEYRHREMEGVPIGFCQCVKKSSLEKTPYFEAGHFEGADWQFAIDIRKHIGKETRLSGAPVLHLEHGGSKWYGTDRHL